MANAAVATAAARASVDWLCNTDCSNGSTRRFFAACYRLERWLEFIHTGYAKQTHFYFSSCWHTDGRRDRSPNAEWVLITLVARSPSSSRGSKDLCGCFCKFRQFCLVQGIAFSALRISVVRFSLKSLAFYDHLVVFSSFVCSRTKYQLEGKLEFPLPAVWRDMVGLEIHNGSGS